MKTDALHEKYMHQCLKLAKKGIGYVSPNPMVGCVVVKNGKVVGRGYHKRFGGAHAEFNALMEAGDSAAGSTVYVNLEPCSHFGKTPPCTDLLITKKVRQVIIGMRDPNPIVNGNGIKKLRAAGITVIEHVLETEAIKLNEVFVKSVKSKLPFVTLKIAETLDGRIADYAGDSKWITNSKSQKYAHKLRTQNSAILVGANTITKDDPLLNVRYIRGKNPLRVIIDGNLSSPLSSRVFNTTNVAKTVIFVSDKVLRTKQSKITQLKKKGVNIISIKSKSNILSIKSILRNLYEAGVNSILVEGGADLHSQFIKNNLVDKLVVIIAPKILGDGMQSVTLRKKTPIKKVEQLIRVTVSQLGEDVMFEGYFNK